MKFIINTSPINQGKHTPGMHILVKSKAAFVENPTQTGLLWAWNQKMEITKKKKPFTVAGGKWLTHIGKDL